jgi:predicted histidine transporter YuiF (NhaC family)
VGASAVVRHAFNTVGTAMWITTVALVAGFMVLVFSGYNNELGYGADDGNHHYVGITILFYLQFLSLFFQISRKELVK